MNEINGEMIINALRELADREVQINRWLNSEGGEQSSFEEAVEGLYSDSGLSIQLGKMHSDLPEDVEYGLVALGREIDKVDLNRHPSAIIDDPQMQRIRTLARSLLERIERTLR